jgi:hypothetical protein
MRNGEKRKARADLSLGCQAQVNIWVSHSAIRIPQSAFLPQNDHFTRQAMLNYQRVGALSSVGNAVRSVASRSLS